MFYHSLETHLPQMWTVATTRHRGIVIKFKADVSLDPICAARSEWLQLDFLGKPTTTTPLLYQVQKIDGTHVRLIPQGKRLYNYNIYDLFVCTREGYRYPIQITLQTRIQLHPARRIPRSINWALDSAVRELGLSTSIQRYLKDEKNLCKARDYGTLVGTGPPSPHSPLREWEIWFLKPDNPTEHIHTSIFASIRVRTRILPIHPTQWHTGHIHPMQLQQVRRFRRQRSMALHPQVISGHR